MDWNRIEGNWKQLKGKVKEKCGSLTEDDIDKIEGRWDQLEGRVKSVMAARGTSRAKISMIE